MFVQAVAPDGAIVVFFTDTGGGYNAVSESVAARYSLAPAGTAISDVGEAERVEFPQFAEAAGIPRPPPDPWLEGNLVVVPDADLEAGGFLGSRWFAGGIWEFDYGCETLSRVEDAAGYVDLAEVRMGFRHDETGMRDLDFPRVTIGVDGQALEMLLDTGATAELTEQAGPVYGLPAGRRVGTSYIVRSVFERWRAGHPDWRVIAEAESVTGAVMPMIEVPAIEIADIRFGPVWFTRRPDQVFHEWMSQMTDEPVDGALGGSALQYLRLAIDYPAAKLYFELLDGRGDCASGRGAAGWSR